MEADAEALEYLVTRSLEEGVPPSVVARIFEIDVKLVKDVLSEVRVRAYGTDDMAEYLEHVQWGALAEAFDIIRHGSYQDRTRFTAAILGKQLAVAGRRTPEGQRELQSRLEEILDKQRTGRSAAQSRPSEFVVGAAPDGWDPGEDDDE